MIPKKSSASIIPIRISESGSTDPSPTPPANSAIVVPPNTRQGTVRERRSNRMLPISSNCNRVAAQLDESVAIQDGIPFLSQTREDICLRFLRGVDERRIAESLSTRHYSVARVDVERVIRVGYRAERQRAIVAEHRLRILEARAA